MRPDRPAYLKLNYATALLLSGQPDACLGVLEQVDDEVALAKRLREAIKRWETTLSFGQKLDWWINHVAPPGRGVPIDFVPGDFGLADSPDAWPSPLPTSQPSSCSSGSIQPSAAS